MVNYELRRVAGAFPTFEVGFYHKREECFFVIAEFNSDAVSEETAKFHADALCNTLNATQPTIAKCLQEGL